MTHIMEDSTASAVGFDVKMGTSGAASIQAKIERLKAIRKLLGWSEEVCAYHLGVTYSTLNRWERGESWPKSRVVLKAIDHFIARYGKRQPERG